MKRLVAAGLCVVAVSTAVPAAAQATAVPATAQATAVPAAAQVAQGPADAAPAEAATPICTDRPTKANVACTVPRGDIQIEADAINWTRFSSGGVDTDTILYTNPTIKYGLGRTTDIEVNIAPYETVRVHGQGDTLGGVGDLYVRLKQQFTAPGARTQVALIPYVKAPTARFGIGNERWEGGVILPVIFTLPSGFLLNFGPEVDVLADSDRHGHHANLVSLVNLSHAVGGKGTIYAEFWNAHNIDPTGTIHQYSADVAYAYLLSPRLQLDLGGNFGLNRFTPGSQVYAGISTRF
ncbi:transporter [Sphingomonas bacterium]|uniref:transporter n=1 Tax=Sphingomonas bacterium TaxID=1895847 RepID=UPI001576CC3E|nr:transporter [Sphingomonas bacterium]